MLDVIRHHGQHRRDEKPAEAAMLQRGKSNSTIDSRRIGCRRGLGARFQGCDREMRRFEPSEYLQLLQTTGTSAALEPLERLELRQYKKAHKRSVGKIPPWTPVKKPPTLD